MEPSYKSKRSTRSSLKHWLGLIATSLALLVAILVVFQALRLIMLGPIVSTAPGSIIGEPLIGDPDTQVQLIPYLPAVIPLVAAIALMVGLLINRLPIAWISLAVLFLFSLLFLLSEGGGFLVYDLLLLIFMGVIYWSRRA